MQGSMQRGTDTWTKKWIGSLPIAWLHYLERGFIKSFIRTWIETISKTSSFFQIHLLLFTQEIPSLCKLTSANQTPPRTTNALCWRAIWRIMVVDWLQWLWISFAQAPQLYIQLVYETTVSFTLRIQILSKSSLF